MSGIFQGLPGEYVGGADLPQHLPPRPLREHEILMLVPEVLGGRVERASQEVGIMGPEELFSHGCRS